MEFSTCVAWIREHGGFVDERVQMAVVDGLRGIFASGEIENGALLFHCPWRLIIGARFDHTDESCDIIAAIETELALGDKSFWHPYLSLARSGLARLPTFWDEEALCELQGIPPYDATRHTDWFSACCKRGHSPSEMGRITNDALAFFITRSTDVGMVPVYDLLNHHNGDLNTVIKITETGVYLHAQAPILAGGQIYATYSIEPSSSIFRDYGFIERWPQTWAWTDTTNREHTFMLFTDDAIAIEPTRQFAGDLGSKQLSLEDYWFRCDEHTRSLSAGALSRFHDAARRLLDERPTNAEEDEQILAAIREQAGSSGCGRNASKLKMKDLVACVEYRLQFKRAVQAAIASAERAMQTKEEVAYS